MKRDPYASLREHLSQPPTHWRSMAHKAGEPSVADQLDVEFPSGTMQPAAFSEGLERRDVLKLAGASMMFASLAGCVRRPEEEILPFTRPPESVIPGVRQMYATVMPRPSGAVGLLVESHDGRPTKIEGNPKHPASLGGSDIWGQAEVLRLYDPDRARGPRLSGKDSTWEAWDAFATEHFAALAKNKGKGLAFLLSQDDSPTFERLLFSGLSKLEEARVFRWDPLFPDALIQGGQLAFGAGARVHYNLKSANVIFALDSNFLDEGPDHLRLAREFAQRRKLVDAKDAATMNRLYVAEGVFSTTGSNADHRLRIAHRQAAALLVALARELASTHGVALGDLVPQEPSALSEEAQKFVRVLAKDLVATRGACALLAGPNQPPTVVALAHAIHVALGGLAAGTLSVSRPANAPKRTPQAEALVEMVRALNADEVQTVVIFDANPLYAAPGATKFAQALARAKTVIHAGVAYDETADHATWHVPAAHFLEAWGDARAWDGTAAITQPLILPLFGARPATSLLAQMMGETERSDRKLVEATWRGAGLSLASDVAWRKALHEGVIADSAFPRGNSELQRSMLTPAVATLSSTAPSATALELVAFASHVLDGRLSNVSWLMELPDNMTKLAWDNAVLMAPSLARQLSIDSAVDKNGYRADVVELSVDDRKITAPVFVLPGLAPFTLAMATGFGRRLGGVAKDVGVSVYPLLGASGGVVTGVKLSKTGSTKVLCSTQDHFSVPGNPLKELTFAQMSAASGSERTLTLANRNLHRSGTASALVASGGDFARKGDMPESLVQLGTPKNQPTKPKQLTDAIVYEGQQWGMAIDLTTCTGCNACVAACVAENNIPVVGRKQVLLGRELHWLRVDRYFTGDVDNPEAAHQPTPCMHCENAPCEPVCPVSATVHDEEGLNAMAYNRCIGTRYCANNCPYKVRRYNYLDFSKSGDFYVDPLSKERGKSLDLQRNPDVSVRYRGVMEKCTYCTQRIEEAKIDAKRRGQDRKALPDGAVVPACAQACASQSIAFGNINDPNSEVAKLKASVRNYEMLQELNTRPRTTYLARVKNKNEELS
ncbi:MAG: Fe-S cluster-containing hydrogenase [Myxococcaceae bacterium]